jgi:serine/threonine protein kinase
MECSLPSLSTQRQTADFDHTSDSRAPLRYDDYVLQRLIGAGRMGKVYRAWQHSLERHVAIKFLRKSFLGQHEAVERFLAEAKTVAQFHHPGIVGVHGVGRTSGGGYFIAMDLIDGGHLGRSLAEAPIPVHRAIDWTVQVCDAIAHAHARGIVHCDLKPNNILLDQDRRVHLTDFGLAQSLGAGEPVTNRIEGTAPFMAPEQVSPFWGSISIRTDVYGIGAVLYALLTGVSPYAGTTVADVLAQVISAAKPVSPALRRPEVLDRISDICLRCLGKWPADRYAHVDELREALAPYLAENAG